MKKILLFFITTLSFAVKWQPVSKLPEYMPYLKPADIIIYKNTNKLHQSYGHNILVNNEKKFVDFFNPKFAIKEMPVEYFVKFDSHRHFIVIRKKDITDEIGKKIVDFFYDEFRDSVYNLFALPNSTKYGTYCSHAIYNSYNKIYGKNVFNFNKFFILPLDFLNTGENFYQVYIP